MELFYIFYKPRHKKPRYVLLYPLGIRNNKLCCLICSEIPKNEIKLIRLYSKNLSTLSLEEKLIWVKKNCPIGKKGYREIFQHNYHVVSKHPIS